jgi:putative endonuclease
VTKQGLATGKLGEDLACDFLKAHGYKILHRNFRTRLGEIDIVAKDKDVLCFIEVKTRTSGDLGLPVESLTYFKQRQIARATLVYLQTKKGLKDKARFDVVSVQLWHNPPKIDIITNAFELGSNYSY